MPKAPYLLRPANYPYGNPGRGYKVFSCGIAKIAVFQLLGQAGFQRVHLANPYHSVIDLAQPRAYLTEPRASPAEEKSRM
jgi:hypothetical protein